MSRQGFPDEAVERFLATGSLPRGHEGWPGATPAERRAAAEADARALLGRIVRWRASHAPLDVGAPPTDTAVIVRDRAGPMVRGLFPADEAQAILADLPAHVRVVTPATFPSIAAELSPGAAWDVANLLLDALGAPPLSDDSPELDGLERGAVGCVLPEALHPPCSTRDVLVHELAHVLHDARRGTFGLRPARAPLLRVPPERRETFAWTCELWSTLERAPALYADWAPPNDSRVDVPVLRRLVAAALAGAGWSAIATWIRG